MKGSAPIVTVANDGREGLRESCLRTVSEDNCGRKANGRCEDAIRYYKVLDPSER